MVGFINYDVILILINWIYKLTYISECIQKVSSKLRKQKREGIEIGRGNQKRVFEKEMSHCACL